MERSYNKDYLFRILWNIMEYYGILWNIMEYYGILWKGLIIMIICLQYCNNSKSL